MTNKFLQPASGIKILERSESRHTLTPEALARGKARVASGENIEQVAKDLIEEQALRVLGGPGSGNFGHAGRPGEVGGSAPASSGGVFTKGISTAPPVSKEIKQKAYDEVKAGGKFRDVAEKYGMTQGQLAGFVYKVDQKKKALEEIIQKKVAQKEGAPIKPSYAAPPPVGKVVNPLEIAPVFSPPIAKVIPSVASIVAKKKTEINAMKLALFEDNVETVTNFQFAAKGSQAEANQVSTVHNGLTLMISARAQLREAGVEPPKITYMFQKLGANTYSAANGSVVKFNSDNHGTRSELAMRLTLKKDKETGFHDYEEPSAVLVHELGHVMHRNIIGHSAFGSLISNYGKEIGKVLTPPAAKEVSHYATMHTAEFVAEAFVGLVSGKPYSDAVKQAYADAFGPNVPKNPTSHLVK